MKLLENISVDVIDQLLIKYSAFIKILEEKWL